MSACAEVYKVKCESPISQFPSLAANIMFIEICMFVRTHTFYFTKMEWCYRNYLHLGILKYLFMSIPIQLHNLLLDVPFITNGHKFLVFC